MRFIADFHTHSKYSLATSRDCVPELLEMWAGRKGLGLIGTGDFTHPAWRGELKEKLVPCGDGLYALRKESWLEDEVAGAAERPRFIISGEISCIYKKDGKTRKGHNLILLPNLETAETLSRRLEAIGNINSDGRPILGLDSRDLLELTLDVCHEAIFIPAHIWTPHFSLLGARSGFDSVRECFGDLSGYIYALETGLSSDPPMNWRLSALDGFALVSNSDAHSPGKLAREANIFDAEMSYPAILRALRSRDNGSFLGTFEFYPQEGKYYFDGHRSCNVCLSPAESRASFGICPVCGGRMTGGVLRRVEDLADRAEYTAPQKYFEHIIPLCEVISAATGSSAASKKTQKIYFDLLRGLGSELFILREAELEDIRGKAGPDVAACVGKSRRGEVEIRPGYDGVYGQVTIRLP